MKVGDWEIQDTIGYLYFSSFILMLLCYIVLIVWMTILIRKEIKQPAVDMFKVIQFVLIIICFLDCIYADICYLWHKEFDTLFTKSLYLILQSSLYLYYSVNCLSCNLLISHINNLK